MICPKCKSNRDVIPISYGKPTPKGFEKSKAGLIKLGGCVLFQQRPQWYCKTDDLSF